MTGKVRRRVSSPVGSNLHMYCLHRPLCSDRKSKYYSKIVLELIAGHSELIIKYKVDLQTFLHEGLKVYWNHYFMGISL